MLKVIHICDKFGMRGSTMHGVSRLFAWWFPRFDGSRYDVQLYALKSPDHASRALEAEVPMTYMHERAMSPTILRSFVRAARQADVLHLHGWIAANFGRIAGRITGVPTIMHEHGVDPQFPGSQKVADRLLSPFTHTAVAVSKSVQEFLTSERFVSPHKIRLVYNGAPVEEFTAADPADVARARAELGIQDGSPVVGTVGRLDTQKGITYLLKAATALPEVTFLIVGDGPRRAELESEARELGIRAIFAGHRSDVPVMQGLMDIQAFPSLWEGTPLTVFEAMAMGKAIVSTDVDGLGEVLTHGRNALVVPPSNPVALAQELSAMLVDRGLTERLAAGARQSSMDYDISQTVRNLESLYEELA
ncbi:MAG: glycosyltransferase family 4 protein [Armatimonadota bacterium]